MDQAAAVTLAALLALAVGWGVRRWVVFLARVESESMLPTLTPGQKVLTRRLATSRPPRRGDVVVVASDELGQVIVKRVAGLPGDRICLDREVRYAVPSGHLLLLGDNRRRSSDSRTWRRHPYVPVDRVLGRVIGLRGMPASAAPGDRESQSCAGAPAG